jgi:hypothetical protein
LLASFLADFHAPTLALPGKAMVSKERSLGCGSTWGASLARWNQSTLSWKTPQLLLLEEGFESLEILPQWGSTVGGELFQRPTPSGLLELRASITSESGYGLPQRAPTPTAGDAKSSGSRNLEGSKAHAGVSLTDYVKTGNSTTPRRVPTPTVQDSSNNGAPSQMDRNTKPLNAEVGGPLNPEWVEWIMGWPIGWTDLNAPATDKFRQWLNSHGKS